MAKVLLSKEIGGKDLEYDFGVVPNSTSDAAANYSAIQAKLDATDQHIYPWIFPVAEENNGHTWVSRTLVVPNDTGRRWIGGGSPWPVDQGSGDYDAAIGIDGATHATTFDGTALNKLTSDGENHNIVTLVGRTVHAYDKWNSIEITGGTGATTGWYGIEGVDTENNAYTLDRDWCASEVTNGAGYYGPTVVRNHGTGHVHSGIKFVGAPNGGGTKTSIIYHVVSRGDGSDEPGSIPAAPGGNPGQWGRGGVTTGTPKPTGKHWFDNCMFRGADVGILCGRHMARAHESVNAWVGRADDHADHISLNKCWFYGCTTGLYCRNAQAVNIFASDCRHSLLNGTMFKLDAGGFLHADGVTISGAGGTSTQTVLELGNKVEYTTTPITIRNVFFDGGGNVISPQLLKTTKLDSSGSLVFDSVKVEGDTATPGFTVPLVDVTGGYQVTLRNIHSIGIWVGALKATVGTGGRQAHIIIENSKLAQLPSQSLITRAEEVIDGSTSSGTVFEFRNCVRSYSHVTFPKYPDGTFVVGKGWVEGGPWDGEELTIASGVISPTARAHTVDTQSDASSDDVDTINGAYIGRRLTLRANNSARTVVLKNGTGNLKLGADVTLDHADDVVELLSLDGTNWLKLYSSDNGS